MVAVSLSFSDSGPLNEPFDALHLLRAGGEVKFEKGPVICDGV